MLTPETARRIIIGARSALGWASLLMPRMVARLFGVDPGRQPATSYLIRLFGIRDILMAYQLYQAQSLAAPPEEVEEVRRQGLLVDGVDLGSAIAAVATGRVDLRTGMLGGLGSAAALGLGLAAAEPATEPV